jgi:hypothetical protein
VGGIVTRPKKYGPSKLLAHWKWLASSPKDTLSRLHAHAPDRARRAPSQSAVACVAEMLNEGVADYCKIPIVFAATIGMSLLEAKDLIVRLSKLSPNAVALRLKRVLEA